MSDSASNNQRRATGYLEGLLTDHPAKKRCDRCDELFPLHELTPAKNMDEATKAYMPTLKLCSISISTLTILISNHLRVQFVHLSVSCIIREGILGNREFLGASRKPKELLLAPKNIL